MAFPGWHGKDRQRCNARTKSRVGGLCRNWPVDGKCRCYLHGGLSTGARTEEGRARQREAMAEGRAIWLERMRQLKAAGVIDKIPGGRRPGKDWTTPAMKARQAAEKAEALRAALAAAAPRVQAVAPKPRRLGRPTNRERLERVLASHGVDVAQESAAGVDPKLAEHRALVSATKQALAILRGAFAG